MEHVIEVDKSLACAREDADATVLQMHQNCRDSGLLERDDFGDTSLRLCKYGRRMSVKRLCIMANFGQAAIGIIVLLVVVCGLLFIYYSRTNAVEKNGYGSLIMLSIVSLMIPVFWIVESNRQASATVDQFNASILRGMVATNRESYV